jgi:hypothetical protein
MAGCVDPAGGTVKARVMRCVAQMLLAGTVLVAAAGCAVTEGGYGYDGSVGVGVDYYEPFGFDYGGWGPGYGGVAPYRGGGPRGGSPPGRSYRPAPSGRAMPSIPSGSRSGGGRSGGGRR